ncbi:hypothetical protein [Streptomyces aureus]
MVDGGEGPDEGVVEAEVAIGGADGLSVGRDSIMVVADYVEDVEWSGLFHAEGLAGDTPRHLTALLGDDAWAFVDGYSHLWSTTLPSGGQGLAGDGADCADRR